MKQTNKAQCGNYYLVSYFNPEMVKSEVREVKGVFIYLFYFFILKRLLWLLIVGSIFCSNFHKVHPHKCVVLVNIASSNSLIRSCMQGFPWFIKPHSEHTMR